MDVITDFDWVYPNGPPTEEELKQMEERERLRLEEIERLELDKERLRLEKQQQIFDNRLMNEERYVRKMIDRDKKEKIAKEAKKRKKAEKEAHKHVKYPDLEDELNTTVYKLNLLYGKSSLFLSKHDALFHGIKELQNGSAVQISKKELKPHSGSLPGIVNTDIPDGCPFCDDPCDINKPETIKKYQDIVKKNDEIMGNNNILIKEYIEKLDTKTEEILKEDENKDNVTNE